MHFFLVKTDWSSSSSTNFEVFLNILLPQMGVTCCYTNVIKNYKNELNACYLIFIYFHWELKTSARSFKRRGAVPINFLLELNVRGSAEEFHVKYYCKFVYLLLWGETGYSLEGKRAPLPLLTKGRLLEWYWFFFSILITKL